jgi:hypothetical protein
LTIWPEGIRLLQDYFSLGRPLFHRQSKQGRCHDLEVFGKLEALCEGCTANGEIDHQMDHFQVFKKQSKFDF